MPTRESPKDIERSFSAYSRWLSGPAVVARRLKLEALGWRLEIVERSSRADAVLRECERIRKELEAL